jgi:hypothetical protein
VHGYDVQPYILTDLQLRASFDLSSIIYHLLLAISVTCYVLVALLAKLLMLAVMKPLLSFGLIVIVVAAALAAISEDEEA